MVSFVLKTAVRRRRKMKVEQFVMAYGIEQDRIRAMLPEGFGSLRPVLRINTEIRESGGEENVYIELNTPVEGKGRRGWMNVASWQSPDTDINLERDGKAVIIRSKFIEIKYEGVGIEGGCPAEKDNDGCFFPGNGMELRPAEQINEKKEFCDCSFAWHFNEGDASGESIGKTLQTFGTEPEKQYERQELTAENAAAIPCEQVLGSYIVRFER